MREERVGAGKILEANGFNRVGLTPRFKAEDEPHRCYSQQNDLALADIAHACTSLDLNRPLERVY